VRSAPKRVYRGNLAPPAPKKHLHPLIGQYTRKLPAPAAQANRARSSAITTFEHRKMNQRRLFLGCFISLVATAFGFAVRGAVLEDWGIQFNLSEEQKGYILGVGLYPFAISIILFSLIVDKIGYGRVMMFAFVGHLVSTIMTLTATSFDMLYWSTFIFALANGAVETVINPVVATIYDKNKTHWLNVLHAGWPGGLVVGGLLAIAILVGQDSLKDIDFKIWQLQMALVLLPTILYGILLFGQKFPEQERVSAGVTYLDMLKEFGWGSAFVCSFLLVSGVNQILLVGGAEALPLWQQAAIALVPTVVFAIYVKSFGRPMFVFLLLIMVLLATTELGTDAWITDIMQAVLQDKKSGMLYLIYTSAIMFVLRFFAGPIVHKLSPLGLLAASAAIATVGLTWLSMAGNATLVLFAAATLYGLGKTFFWPTTLGVVSEQFPKGGALMLNAIAGVGMLSVGVLGGPVIGTLQDATFAQQLEEKHSDLAAKVVVEKEGMLGKGKSLDNAKVSALPESDKKAVAEIVVASKQGTLEKIAVLPAIMFACYVVLILYFRSRGGYKVAVLHGGHIKDEKYTGGVEGPVK
jgi:MFS family permease